MFERTAGSWRQTSYLKPSTTMPELYFGSTAAIHRDTIALEASGDRSRATGISGDPNDRSAESSGAVHVFAR